MSFRKLPLVLTMAAAGLASQPALSHSAHSGFAASNYSGVVWFLAAFELGPWEEYLAWELTPEFSPVKRTPRPEVTWLSLSDSVVLPDFARDLLRDKAEPVRLNWDLYESSRIDLSSNSGQLGAGTFERSMMFSGVSQPLGDRSRISVSAILASQQYSHSLMDTRQQDVLAYSDFADSSHPLYREVSHGTGVRLAFSSELAPRLGFSAAFQSRINMDELANVRGVHGYSADLDIPSRMQVGLDFQTTRRSSVSMAVSQVFYSEVGAFPSRALPARFNALLGDSNSPDFGWEDLTIYSLGLRWVHESDLEFSVDFHTRSQPSPTAPSLAQALNGELAQQSLLVGVGKGIGPRSWLQFNASYAPPEFAFGGNVMGVVSERLDQALEVSASLRVDL